MRRLIHALLALLLGGLLGRWLGEFHAPNPLAEPAPAPETAVSPDVPVHWTLTPVDGRIELPTPASPRALPTLPLVGTRLADSLAALRRRAEAGDIDAALRLSREQQACLAAMAVVPHLGPGSPPELEFEALRCLHRTHCQDLPPAALNPIEALGLAALAGDDDAAIAYAGAPLLMVYHLADPNPTLDAWAQQSPLLLERALHAGHPLALPLLAEAWTGGQRVRALARLLPADPARGLSLLWAFQQVPGAGAWFPQLQSAEDWYRLGEHLGLEPESLPELLAEGNRYYQRHLSHLTDLDADLQRFNARVQPLGNSVWRGLEQISPTCHAELHRQPAIRALQDRPLRQWMSR